MLERRGGISARVGALLCLAGGLGTTTLPPLAGVAALASHDRLGLAAAFLLLALSAFASLLALFGVVAAGHRQRRGRASQRRSRTTSEPLIGGAR